MRAHVDLLERFQLIAVRMEHVEKTNHVFMVHMLEQTQLTICTFCMDGRLKWTGQLFDGNLYVIGGVEGRTKGKDMKIDFY